MKILYLLAGVFFLSNCGKNTKDGQEFQIKSATIPANALTVLEKSCGACHGSQSPGFGGFKGFDNVDLLVSKGYIAPKNLDKSRLYQRIVKGTMPPIGLPRPSANDIKILEDWIQNGNFSSKKSKLVRDLELLETIAADIKSNDVTLNPFIRYVSLASLANAGSTAEEMAQYRRSLVRVINSLSMVKELVQLEAVDANELVYRLDLKKLGWDPSVWEKMALKYPYPINQADTRPLVTSISSSLKTTKPFIRADWFVQQALNTSLYYDFLALPATFDELQIQLGIDVNKNIRDNIVMRAGFNNSGVSAHNRVIERHPSKEGSFWLSYDFNSDFSKSDIFLNPLGPKNIFDSSVSFEHAGGEIIFNLPNGLQAYYLLNAAGRRLNEAPTNIVFDPRMAPGAIINGVSCMSCHEQGLNFKANQIVSDGFSENNKFIIKNLYKPTDVMERRIANDSLSVKNALSKLEPRQATVFENTNLFLALNDRYQRPSTIAELAGELGYDQEGLIALKDRVYQPAVKQILIGLAGGRNLPRVVLEEFYYAFGQLMEESEEKPAEIPEKKPVEPSVSTTLSLKLQSTMISAGSRFTCIIMRDTTVRCWGMDSAQTAGSTLFKSIPGLTGVQQISSGYEHSCAVLKDGTVRCWGINQSGKLGGSSPTVSIPDLFDVVQVTSGREHSCALTKFGTVYCWGSIFDGVTAGSSTTDSVRGLSGVIQIAAGSSHTCALLKDTTVRCWGRDFRGTLGESSQTSSIPGLTGVAQISVSSVHNCAVLQKNGEVRCWGSNQENQLAYSSLTESIIGLGKVVQISSNVFHNCVVIQDGSVRCWGTLYFGEGGGTNQSRPIPNLAGAVQVAAGEFHSCAAFKDFTVRCWGDDKNGELEGSSISKAIDNFKF